MAATTDSTRHTAPLPVEETSDGPSRRAPRGMVNRSLLAQFGRQVRDVYADIATKPVPERLVRLLVGKEK